MTSLPGTLWQKERTDLGKLSSDRHTCPVMLAHTPVYSHTQILVLVFINDGFND